MKTIGICARALSSSLKATFESLGQALDVSFEERPFGDTRNVIGWIVLGADRQALAAIRRSTEPCYVVLDDAELSTCGSSSRITFSNCSEMSAVLRGRDITADDATDAKTLPQWLSGVVPLGFKDGSALWAIEGEGACRHHYVALALPELGDGEALFTHFSGQRLARLLPLVLFVRSVLDDQLWEPPPLQATFMFDDPNLHWTSYGFIDYREMIRRAVAGNYHVSIATIPLDAWFVHPPAGAIFKANPARISLLYHGNDHVYQELARSQSAETMHRILRQAVARIVGMEVRTGLEVARVLAPPHGACSETALLQMARLGFEAVCISRGSLRHHNDGAVWTRAIGMKPCDVVAGLPIIPRFRLSANSRNDVLIAALLRQPIVAVTHHQAVASGYGLLDDTASFINSLGDVAWRDMRTISRSLYSHRREDRTLCIRMLSKHVHVEVPEDTTQIRIERSWVKNFPSEVLRWRRASVDPRWHIASQGGGIIVEPGVTLEIASGPISNCPTKTDNAAVRLAPVVRRVLTEARDRVLPSIHRIGGVGRSGSMA
jgi:hypothetical protein